MGGGAGSDEVLICTMATNTRHDEGRHNRALILAAPTMQARIAELEAQVAAQHDAMRTEWKDLLARAERAEADAEIGRKWRADSSLETWFPYTAEELTRLRAELAAARARLAALEDEKNTYIDYVGDALGQDHDGESLWDAAQRVLSERDKLRAELATLRAERDALRAAGEAALRTLDNVRVFVTSRERIHKPSGEEWFEGCVKALRAALEER